MLLRNTFSADIYNSFVMEKKDLRHKIKRENAERDRKLQQFLMASDKQLEKESQEFKERLWHIKQIKEAGV